MEPVLLWTLPKELVSLIPLSMRQWIRSLCGVSFWWLWVPRVYVPPHTMPLHHGEYLQTWVWIPQHPRKKQGVVTCTYNPFLRNRETWWFMGLTGHQPSQKKKKASCRFGERPSLTRIKQRNIPLASSCARTHTHTHLCIYHTHNTTPTGIHTYLKQKKRKIFIK